MWCLTPQDQNSLWEKRMAKELLEGEEVILRELIAAKYDLPVDAVQLEMLDFFKIVANGAKKYSMNNWLRIDGKSTSETAMHDHIFHHIARSFAARHTLDNESGEDHLLHAMCREGMLYTRRKRGIVHPEDRT